MIRVQTTKVYSILDEAVQKGFTTISEQGSARSGKTWNTLIWIIIYCLNHPKTTVSIVRKTNPALTGSVMRDFVSIIQSMGIWDKRDFNKTQQMYAFSNGSWVEFFSTDDEQKLRGRKRQILYVNEGNELLEIEWKQLKMRTTKLSIIDYNPSFGEDHWLNGLNDDPRTCHFITTYKDNPFLEQTIIDEIESYKDTNPSLWRIYGLGLRAIVEGLVFENWDVVDAFPQCAKEGIGLDFGYSHDPSAAVKCGLTGNDFYIDELFYRTNMLTRDIAAELKKYDLDVIADSADPRLIDEIFNEQVLIYPVRKFSGSIMAGIMKMQEFRIHVTRNSVNLIKELKNYTYQQDKNGVWLNKPVDAWNHAIDAARYWVLAEVLGHVSKVVQINENDLCIF
jgi:phage terminase large subunit